MEISNLIVLLTLSLLVLRGAVFGILLASFCISSIFPSADVLGTGPIKPQVHTTVCGGELESHGWCW